MNAELLTGIYWPSALTGLLGRAVSRLAAVLYWDAFARPEVDAARLVVYVVCSMEILCVFQTT